MTKPGIADVRTGEKPRNCSVLVRALLACGVILGPLFYIVVAIQMLTRTGYDITRHPLSLLSLGDGGWVQTTNFILTGLLAIGCAAGMRLLLHNSRGGTLGPLLIGTFGQGMITAGVFPADPALGFPPGTPDGVPESLSGSAVLHGTGFFLAFVSLTGACFIFARRFMSLGSRGWGLYCVATGAVILPIVFTGMAIPSATSILLALVGIVAFGWVSALAAHLSVAQAHGTYT